MPEEKKTETITDPAALEQQKVLDELRQVIDATKTSTTTPLEVKLSTGEVFKGATPDELIRNLVKAKEDTTVALRDREAQIRHLRTETRETEPAPTKTAPGFTQEEYLRLWERDARAAADYLDSYRFDIEKPEDVAPTFQEAITRASAAYQILEVAKFHQRTPEFPGGEEAADMLLRRLNAQGLPVSADNLELVYLAAVRAGEIKPTPKPEDKDAGGSKPPPPLGSGGGQGSAEYDAVAEFEGMTKEEQEKVLRGLGLLKS